MLRQAPVCVTAYRTRRINTASAVSEAIPFLHSRHAVPMIRTREVAFCLLKMIACGNFPFHLLN